MTAPGFAAGDAAGATDGTITAGGAAGFAATGGCVGLAAIAGDGEGGAVVAVGGAGVAGAGVGIEIVGVDEQAASSTSRATINAEAPHRLRLP